MKWYGLWHGGSSYAPPGDEDLEEFASLEEAKDRLGSRWRYGYGQRQDFRYTAREPQRVFTPCVGEDCEILLYADLGNLSYPARRVFLGPRGGACIENC